MTKSAEDVYVKEFRRQRDGLKALANLVEPKADTERTRCMIIVARGLAEVCEMLAFLRIDQLEAEG
jgi:hypothetical protein